MYSCQFSKNFPLTKNGGHFEFSNFCQKMEKHKFASISLTMRDRAFLLKFSTPRISNKCTLGNFQKIFPSPKMAAILNFRIFAKNGKTQICYYLLNRADRAISLKFSTHRVSLRNVLLAIFKKFSSPQKWQNRNLFLSP